MLRLIKALFWGILLRSQMTQSNLWTKINPDWLVVGLGFYLSGGVIWAVCSVNCISLQFSSVNSLHTSGFWSLPK